MKFSAVSLLQKRATFACRRKNTCKQLCLGLAFTGCLITWHYLRTIQSSSKRVMIIYTAGSYRANAYHEKPETYQATLKLLRWYNAGDLVWQYAASSLIDTTRMLMCRTDTVDCVTLANELKINSIMYRPEANLLAQKGMFESRRNTMNDINENILGRDIPILFVGIGTQGEFSKGNELLDVDSSGSIESFADDYNMSTEGKLMLKKLKEMKMPVLMRGKFSAQVARRSGMSRALPCGCPSLLINEDLLMGRRLEKKYDRLKVKANDTKLRVAINIKPRLTNLLEMHLKLGERYPNSIFFVQESNDVRILREKGVQFHRIHVAMSYETWKEKLCQMDVSVGSRIHGNMAALGCPEAVPAVVIAADHRVLELTQEMQVPHLTIFEDVLRCDDWFSRVLTQVTFDGESFDQNRCDKAKMYVQVFEQHSIKPSSKLRAISDSCVGGRIG